MHKIVALISGGGTNLQSIIDHIENGNLKVKLSYVIADRPAYGLKRASKYSIPNRLIDKNIGSKKWTNIFLKTMKEVNPDLIVLAGFLSILNPKIINQYNGRIINIHPALLPKYGGKGMFGMNVHKAVIKEKQKESGCTVHLVDAGIDTGGIILQKKVTVLPDDTPKTLQKRILAQEHLALVEAISKILNLP